MVCYFAVRSQTVLPAAHVELGCILADVLAHHSISWLGQAVLLLAAGETGNLVVLDGIAVHLALDLGSSCFEERKRNSFLQLSCSFKTGTSF